MPHQPKKPLPKEAMDALKKNLEEETTPANREIYPMKVGTSAFAEAAKKRFDEKMEEFKAEMGQKIYDEQCAVAFVCAYDGGLGVCDGTEGRTGGLMMMMATVVLRLAEVTMVAQKYRPKQDSMHKICAGIIHRLMQMIMVMVPSDGAAEEPKKESGIIIP